MTNLKLKTSKTKSRHANNCLPQCPQFCLQNGGYEIDKGQTHVGFFRNHCPCTSFTNQYQVIYFIIKVYCNISVDSCHLQNWQAQMSDMINYDVCKIITAGN